MAVRDLRGYTEELEKYGELKNIDLEVHWNLEASAITAMNAMTGGPALLFNNLKGYGPGNGRLAGCYYTGPWEQPWRRYNIALGLHPDTSYDDFMYEYLARAGNTIKPNQVSTGDCKEVILTGDDVNLFKFPWPYIHKGDGGRYGTIGFFAIKDPDSDWVNWSNYRALMLGKNKMTLLMSKGQQGGFLFYEKWEPKGKPCPVAYVVGGDPSYFMASASYLPEGQNEVDMAGGLRDAPVELVKCETHDLLVPADAEIVIEGFILPGKRVDEGPFGEYFGFIHGPRRPMPLIQVTCITHRENPIIPFVPEGIKGTDGQTLASCTWCIGFWAYLALVKGYPVKRVWMPRETPYNMFVVSMDRLSPGIAKEIMDSTFHLSPMGHIDHIALVDGDIDPKDVGQFVEEFATKMHPKKDFLMTDWNMPKVTLTVYLSPEERKQGLTKKMAFDCTTKEWDEETMGPKRMTFETLYSDDVQEWAIEKYNSLGLEEKAISRKVEDVELFIPTTS